MKHTHAPSNEIQSDETTKFCDTVRNKTYDDAVQETYKRFIRHTKIIISDLMASCKIICNSGVAEIKIYGESADDAKNKLTRLLSFHGQYNLQQV